MFVFGGWGFQAFLSVPVPPGGNVARTCTHFSRQFEIDKVLVFTNGLCTLPDFRLVLPNPEGFGGHPLGRNRTLSATIHLQGGIAAAFIHDLLRLRSRSGIHPQETVSEWFVVLVQGNHGAAGCVDTHAAYLVIKCVQRINGTPHGFSQALVPVFWILFRPSGIGMVGFIGRRNSFANHVSGFGIKATGSNGLRSSVDTDDKFLFQGMGRHVGYSRHRRCGQKHTKRQQSRRPPKRSPKTKKDHGGSYL
mmetsp:Transcript_10183/g.25516  ORF Transcript_10183/g.25516 Transcript_10183/m.25516 type:complete len:249 (+) Transcript_10183:1745-2491(+)